MFEVAFFDIDDTLIKGQSPFLFVKYLFRKGKFNYLFLIILSTWVILYKSKLIKDVEPAMRKGFGVIKGWKLDEAKRLVDDFFEKELRHRIYSQALVEINKHKKNKRKIVLISNTPQIIVDKFVEELSADYGFGTQLETKKGIFTGQIIGKPMYADRKVEVAQKLSLDNDLDIAKSWAYSDHHSDIALLGMAGSARAVNPDSLLRDYAIKHNWKILNFSL